METKREREKESQSQRQRQPARTGRLSGVQNKSTYRREPLVASGLQVAVAEDRVKRERKRESEGDI